MVFTSVAGHLMELDFPEPYKRWHSCSPLELYGAPVVKIVPQVWKATSVTHLVILLLLCSDLMAYPDLKNQIVIYITPANLSGCFNDSGQETD